MKLFQLTHTAIVSICQALISISTPIRVIRIGQCVGSNHHPSLLCGRSPHSPITRQQQRQRQQQQRSNNCNKSNPLSCLDHAQFPFYALAVQLSDLSFAVRVGDGVGVAVGVGVAGAGATSQLRYVDAAATAANSQLNFSGNQAITSCNMPCCTIAFDSLWPQRGSRLATTTATSTDIDSFAFASTADCICCSNNITSNGNNKNNTD